jgi:hypothetical protein
LLYFFKKKIREKPFHIVNIFMEEIAMRKIKWTLVCLVSLSLLGAPQVFAAGKGKGVGQGKAHMVELQAQNQWEGNQPPGWNSQGQKKGWSKHESTTPVGVNKNLNKKGKYPKGLEKK